MEYFGQRFINAPRSRVWSALLDAQTLSSCFAAPDMVRKVGDDAFSVGSPINQTVTLSGVRPLETLTFTGTKGGLHVTLAEEGPQMTRLSYVLTAPSLPDVEANLDSVLSAFQTEVAGAREIAAGAIANAQAATTGT